MARGDDLRARGERLAERVERTRVGGVPIVRVKSPPSHGGASSFGEANPRTDVGLVRRSVDDDVVTWEEKIGVSETRREGGEELGGGAAEDHLAACAERGGLDAHDGLEDGVGAVDDGDGAVGRRVARAELAEGTAHVLANRVGDGGGGLGPAGVLHQGPAVEEGGETRADRGEAGGRRG